MIASQKESYIPYSSGGLFSWHKERCEELLRTEFAFSTELIN